MCREFIMNEYFKSKENFYPTPKGLAEKMCEYLDGTEQMILEPSAGKGDLLEAVIEWHSEESRHCDWHIDYCELDDELRSVLLANYSEAGLEELKKEKRSLEDRDRVYDREERCYRSELSEAEKERLRYLDERVYMFDRITFQMVQEDFLKYQTWKRYDAIIMNPPFAEGDAHLLQAIRLMKYGGKIICLLNKETIDNPYTNQRKLLQQKLHEFNAEIEYLPMQFMSDDCERKTSVEVALVKMTIPEDAGYKSQILDGLDKARKEQKAEYEAREVSTKIGWIDGLIEQCEYEMEMGLHLYREYMSVLPYMCKDYEKDRYSQNMISLRCGDKEFDPNRFTLFVREKYWKKFFSNEEFQKALTSNLTNMFNSIVTDAAQYEFTRENVKKILDKMNVLMVSARDETILDLFDKLSAEHSWFPESGRNIHYYNGWATNKAHKINDKKVILPVDGFSAYSRDRLDTYHITSTLSDMEKVFNYLAVGSDECFLPIDIYSTMQRCSDCGITKDIRLKYFEVTFYKKGTCHISFYPETKPLIEKLNIFGSQKKGWLPPCYGKKAYKDMTEEEKAVVADFQGEERYAEVISRSEYYLESETGFDGVFALECAS